MHSSWFRKPVYKRVRWLAIFFIAGSLAYAYFYPAERLYVVFFSLLWLIFSMICSFNIRSGAYLKTINAGDKNRGNIYLTFDDGPGTNTLQIMEILDRNQAKATFFVTGERAEKNPEILQILSKRGHCIGNHSYSHKPWFPILPIKKIKKEIDHTQSVITQITGTAPRYFRPPFGVTNPLIAKALKSFNLIVIGWTIRSLDTVVKDPELIIARIKKQLKPGSIVLLHDTTPKIDKALDSLLNTCQKSGLAAVSINELKI